MPKPNTIPDRKTTTDVIASVMQELCPSWSIDTLLTYPHTAIKVAQECCRRLERRPTNEAVHGILRCALSSRKRGDLRRDVH